MFRKKIRLIDKQWDDIKSLKVKERPIEGDYIYVGDLKCYYKVVKIIHSIIKKYEFLVVVEKINDLKKKLK